MISAALLWDKACITHSKLVYTVQLQQQMDFRWFCFKAMLVDLWRPF